MGNIWLRRIASRKITDLFNDMNTVAVESIGRTFSFRQYSPSTPANPVGLFERPANVAVTQNTLTQQFSL